MEENYEIWTFAHGAMRYITTQLGLLAQPMTFLQFLKCHHRYYDGLHTPLEIVCFVFTIFSIRKPFAEIPDAFINVWTLYVHETDFFSFDERLMRQQVTVDILNRKSDSFLRRIIIIADNFCQFVTFFEIPTGTFRIAQRSNGNCSLKHAFSNAR